MVRENIYAAVFAFFSNLTLGSEPLFRTATRKPRTWEQVPKEDQPALLMVERSEVAEPRRALPTRWTFNLDLLLYVHTGAQTDTDVTPASLLNPLLDAIEAAIVIDGETVYQRATLGDIVNYCAIEGTVEKHLGSLGDDAVAIVPLVVRVSA